MRLIDIVFELDKSVQTTKHEAARLTLRKFSEGESNYVAQIRNRQNANKAYKIYTRREYTITYKIIKAKI